MTGWKKWIAAATLLSVVISSGAGIVAPQDVAASTDYEVADYYCDQNAISDEALFGEWDAENATWTVRSALDYESYPALAEVETAVRAGDYLTAKEKLREYYIDKFKGVERTLYADGSDRQRMDYLLVKNDIVYCSSECIPLATATANADWSWLEIDYKSKLQSIAGQASREAAVMFMALEKDDNVIEIHSRENGEETAPYVEAMVNGVMQKFYATADAYISAGGNSNRNFGTETVLKVAESLSSNKNSEDPVDAGTFRTYLKFDFSSLNAGDTIDSAVLKLYARNAGSEDTNAGKVRSKEMMMWNVPETIWTETGLKWTSGGGILHYVYSFSGADGPSWYLYNAVNHYQRVEDDPVRFFGWSNTLGYYQYTKDPEVLYQLTRRLMHYIKLQPTPAKYGFPLDVATRADNTGNFLVHIAEETDVVPTDVFVGILKYCYLMATQLYDSANFSPGNNWGMYQTKGFLRMWGLLSEVREAEEWRQTIQERLELLLDTNMFSDYSSIEVALGYAKNTGTDFTGIGDLIEATGHEMSEFQFSDSYEQKLYNFCRYFLDISGPGFVDHQQGDTYAYTSSLRTQLLNFGEYFNDDNMLWAGSNGQKGTQPEYTSVLYPKGGKVAMRSDWSENALYLQSNADAANNSHGHYDDLAVILFAYGNYLLVDPLYYSYTTDQYRTWLISNRAHNTIMVNGKNQNRYTDVGTMKNWETNNGFDYVSETTTTIADADFTRNIFFKKGKFWIVTDYLHPYADMDYKYEQLWHFLPEADITVDTDDMRIETHFGEKANLKVIPVGTADYAAVVNDDEDSSGLKWGYYSRAGGNLEDARYASYIKSGVQGDTTFNTILFPTAMGEDYDIATEVVAIDLPSAQAAALKLQYAPKDGGRSVNGVYYNLLDTTKKAERAVDTYTTDARLMYAEKEGESFSSLSVSDATHVKETQSGTELVKSDTSIDDLYVEWQTSNIFLYSGEEQDLEHLTVSTNGRTTTRVYWNDEQIPFQQQGGYVYFGDAPIIEDSAETPTPTPNGNTNGAAHGASTGGGGGGSVSVPSPSATPTPTPTTSADVPKAEFADVSAERWSAEYIYALKEDGTVSGVDETHFEPERSVTRDEFVKMLLEALHIPTENAADSGFDDVDADAWNAPYINTAAQLGIVQGVSKSVFGTGMPITREEMAVMAVRALTYLGTTETDGVQTTFADAADISAWAYAAVAQLSDMGILSGNENGEFMPKGLATREQAAKIIYLIKMMKY